MNRCEFAVAVRAVKAAGISWGHFVSKGLLTYLACVLPPAVVEIEILVACTAVRAVAFKGEILSVFNRKDIFDGEKIFGFDLLGNTGLNDRRNVYCEVCIRDHGIRRCGLLLMGIGVDEFKERFEEFVEILRNQTCGGDEFIKQRVIDQICQFIRDIRKQG
jgi:hypothetical protein